MEKFLINLCGEIIEVGINFFNDQVVLKEDKIGDVYFIRIENKKDEESSETLTYSIHVNFYESVKIELRNMKINNILRN